MTFDPVVAYRILREKQDRLYLQAGMMRWEAIYDMVSERITRDEERRLCAIADKITDEADNMYRVLEYLRERIDKEQES